MEEVTVADQSAGEVDVLSSALGDLGFSPEPAKAEQSEASESDSDLSQDEEDKPESAEDPAEDVSEAEEAEEEQDEEAEDVPREKIQRRIDKLTAAGLTAAAGGGALLWWSSELEKPAGEVAPVATD